MFICLVQCSYSYKNRRQLDFNTVINSIDTNIIYCYAYYVLMDTYTKGLYVLYGNLIN